MTKENLELFRKYRPAKLSEVAGQREAIATLKEFSKRNAFPHAMLFQGPSGTGKTTLARIVAARLGCSAYDLREINSANFRGIDDVRKIQSEVDTYPLAGPVKVYICDEMHNITGDGQDCFLKLLEEPPSYVYFLLATSNPKKLKSTFLSRCTVIQCSALKESDLEELVYRVAEAEQIQLEKTVSARIASVAEGNARTALVLLNSLIGVTDPKAQLAVIERRDVAPASIDICRILFGTPVWSKVANILARIEDEPESVRRVILGYAKSVLLKSGSRRAFEVIEEFRKPLYDIGMPGLVASCYKLCQTK